MQTRAIRRLSFWTLILFLVWLSLPERFDAFHVALGVVGAVFIALVNTDLKSSRKYSIRWSRALLYFPWLFLRILASGLHVSYLILHPRLPIRPRLITYPTNFDDNHAALMLLGNSITLTPGTVTVEAGDGELVVHALDADAAASVTGHRLRDQVAAVFNGDGGRRQR